MGVILAGTIAASALRTLPVQVTQPPAALQGPRHLDPLKDRETGTNRGLLAHGLSRSEAETGFTPRQFLPPPPPTSLLTGTSYWYQAQSRPSRKICRMEEGASVHGDVVGGWAFPLPLPCVSSSGLLVLPARSNGHHTPGLHHPYLCL